MSTMAQQTGYTPFVEEGKVWHMLYDNPEAAGMYPSYEFCYFIKGDTMIADWSCMKLYVYNEDNNKTTDYKMAIYEKGRKVYFIPKETTESYILYDFSIPVRAVTNVADAIHPEWKINMRNNGERNIATDGISRHCLLVNRIGDPEGNITQEGYPSGWWIEGIGSELGPFNTWLFKAEGNSFFMSYCEINGQRVFTLSDFKKNTAQEYFPEGTRWTEIRLDTLKYDSWYSRVGDEWVPNFETVEYYVKGVYIEENWDGANTFTCVYSSGLEWGDSLTFMIWEGTYNEENSCVMVTIPTFFDGELAISPGMAYQFGWDVGKKLYYQNIEGANCDCVPPKGIYDFGSIDEIKERYFGGARPLKYIDLNGTRIIQGIGVIEWHSGECIFGPVEPYAVGDQHHSECHYRSMLVHFERDGEVLYDVWPEPEKTDGIENIVNSHPSTRNAQSPIYHDLSGRCTTRPVKGVYIRQGQKVVK